MRALRVAGWVLLGLFVLVFFGGPFAAELAGGCGWWRDRSDTELKGFPDAAVP
jgi:hypothetical protein